MLGICSIQDTRRLLCQGHFVLDPLHDQSPWPRHITMYELSSTN